MTDFVCKVEKENPNYLAACKDVPEYLGTEYCVLHYPDENKNKEHFEKVLACKLALKDYEFGGTVFPERTSRFEEFVFDADVDFTGATFHGAASFFGTRFCGEAAFSDAKFGGRATSFSAAQFGEAAHFWGTRFCGEAAFSDAKFGGRQTSFSEAEFGGGADFSRTQYSGEYTSFSKAKFRGERANFHNTRFSAEKTTFQSAQFDCNSTHFSSVKFGGRTYFNRTSFRSEETHFVEAIFSNGITFASAEFGGGITTFSRAQFSSETHFDRAKFGSTETEFREATFLQKVSFDSAAFTGRCLFVGTSETLVFGSQTRVEFDNARIEKPELLIFNAVLLHPNWFINTDMRRVDFTEVKWYGMPGGPEGTLDEEIGALTRRNIESPYALLSQACQRLAANAEENRDYRLANDFYYWAMDALRKAGWRKLGLIRTLYWALSGYGVRAARAFLVLAGICVVFSVLYMLFGPNVLRVSSASSFGQALEHSGQAVVYSLSAMARLNPEPKPDPGLFQFLVTIEGILGPLQIALLALAIRRKVMR